VVIEGKNLKGLKDIVGFEWIKRISVKKLKRISVKRISDI